jgi:hypothetical protein
VLRPLDLWLQQVFVPVLEDNVRVVLAGREGPMAGWSLAMGQVFRSLPLGNLPRHDAEALLRRDGVGGDDVERIQRLARGHPLSLRLAASALVAGPSLDHDVTTVTAIVTELTELYLERLDPQTRRALDAASVVRRPTLSLMGAMLPDAAPQDAFDRLRVLPFVELSSDGLVIHDTVREVVAAYLRATDPDRSRRYRIAAWRQLRDEVTRATSQEMWRYTADLLTSSRTRPSARRSSRRPSTSSSSIRRRTATGRRSTRSRRRPNHRSRSRSSRTGGAACPTRSGPRGTAPGTSWASPL